MPNASVPVLSTMHPEKCRVMWHNYSDHLKSMMKELMMNEDYSDVTLVTEDKKQIKANISVLSACSPVFKDILKKEKNTNQIMYLRGIQYSEMESIMQFIYLGEATFYEKRMDEFIAVAKSLEIKELCNAETETKPDDEPPQCDSETSTKRLVEETILLDHIKEEEPQERSRAIVDVNNKYECDQCQNTYSRLGSLSNHKQSVHEGVKYDCDKCDHQATRKGDLKRHVQSNHEGVRYACDKCDYKATKQSHLSTHIRSIHLGIKYACDQCDNQFTQQSSLRTHIKYMHGVIPY